MVSADPTVSTDWLAAHLGRPGLRVLDGSWFMPAENRNGREEYLATHIPGAAFFDIDLIADQNSPLPHMLPSPEAFAGHMARLGVSNGDMVVVYDAKGLSSAARVWWTLKTMGHDDVAVLDGGLPKWKLEGRALEAGEAKPAPGRFEAHFRPELVRDIAQVRQALGAAQIVDARPAARFTAEQPEPRAGLRSGHMPGARSLPASTLASADGTLLLIPALEALFAAAGVDPSRPIIATCGSGITASAIALAQARLGGPPVAVYDGSWTEWGAQADTPVVAGPA
jgi:thiosulfate/3-mercaptopyruvate sulfurtransferase